MNNQGGREGGRGEPYLCLHIIHRADDGDESTVGRIPVRAPLVPVSQTLGRLAWREGGREGGREGRVAE